MAITSFYLLNMFPRMRTLHHHPIIITHHPTAKHVPSDAHFIIITQQSSPNTQAKHIPSDAHFTSSPNNQHPTAKPNMFPRMRTLSSSPNNQYPTPRQNMFPRMRTLRHHPTINTHHPTIMSVIQQISPSNSLANSSSRSRWSSRIGEIPPMKSVTRFPSFVSTTTGNLPLKDML